MRIVSVQVGQARKLLIGSRVVMSAIHKSEVVGRVAANAMGLEGDEQSDLSVHGGLEKAIYAYPSEHYGFWRGQRARAGVATLEAPLAAGAMGENLTLAGLLETDVWVGDVLEFANCTLRVAQPREPCFKFNAALGFNTAVKDMAQSGFCGFYLTVEKVGSLEAGESFILRSGPRRVSIVERFSAKMFKHIR